MLQLNECLVKLAALEARLEALELRSGRFEGAIGGCVERVLEVREALRDLRGELPGRESVVADASGEPWVVAGMSRRTWYRRRKAGAL